MHVRALLTLPLLGAAIVLPPRASAQVAIHVSFGTRLGPEIGVFNYAPERLGDWRTNYRQWRPVTLYDVNGHYYRSQVRGARPVLVYSYRNEYFLPPQDHAWRGVDRRYNYGRQPTPDDYGRARPYESYTVDPRLGAEIGVLGYSEERAGAWRRNYRRWTPVTVYEVNGRYYPRNAPNARAVQVYRYRQEYFLPPDDQKWVGSDRRFNYDRQPRDDDRRRVRNRP
jgi:hypothetical protein